MSFNLQQHYDDLLFLPLGGAGEIGMNLNLYHLEGKWMMIDLGAGFADDYLPGADIIVPDIDFIYKHRSNLLGIVLTHAHEDHLGAIQYLWDELKVPVYATSFTANLLKTKLAEFGLKNKVNIIEVKIGGQIKLGPFNLEMVPLTHSAPEMQAIAIHTKHGTIFHTGDWKFDPDPIVGNPSDLELLKKYGEKGVLALVGDSTNVFTEGFSGSEGKLKDSLRDLIINSKELVIVTTFASNVARMETILSAARHARRKIMVAGKSMWRVLRAAQESGYLTEYNDIIDISQFNFYKRDELVILCTGCQGEPLAAMTKMANKEHQHINLKPGDNVIFSSKIIPGNEKSIYRLFNMLVDIGVEVLTEKDHFVHVSGHPAKGEMKLMYELIRPKISIPVHGELIHMHEHAKLALEWGVPQAIQVKNGDIVKLSDNESRKIGHVQAGYFAVDGNYLISANSPVMRMRRRIRIEGVVIAAITIDNKWRLCTSPLVTAPGLLDDKEDTNLISDIITEIEKNLESSLMSKKGKLHTNDAEQIIRTAIRRIIRRELGKEPPIQVFIQEIN